MINELIEKIESKDYKSVHEMLAKQYTVDLADLLDELDVKNLAIVFRMLEKEQAAEVFSYMDNDSRQRLLEILSSKELDVILDLMATDDAVDFLEDMPANVVTKLLETVDSKTRSDINRLLQYPEDSVGSIMTTEFVELYPEMTVKQALDKIRTVGIDSETIYTCYVVERKKLLGIITAKDLITNPVDTLIKDLMTDNFIYVQVLDDQEYAAKLFRRYDFLALPVLDKDKRIVGIVTFDDAMDVLVEETTEDMHLMAAMSSHSESYLKTTVFEHARHRVFWLLLLMLSASITGSIIADYEDAFLVLPLLVSFIPMLMDTGGNSGSQSSTLIIRGLAVDEIHFNDFFKILWIEFRVSLLVGSALAIANGIRIFLVYKSLDFAIVVSISLISTVVISKLVGSMLPLLAGKLKLDPAIMAAPLITTIVDTCSIIIYFKIATTVFAL
ncbi:MAG TPA: magnesium transporter [Syntrophomonadaceae bacterium]|nr:magnesium transporter [Syntrophomonadaceae bacterium]